MITRDQYMNGSATHSEYYSDLVREIEASDGLFDLPCSVDRVAEAFKKDPHLNTIPLRHWDQFATIQSGRMVAALKARGDSYTLAGGVCILKEAARLRIS